MSNIQKAKPWASDCMGRQGVAKFLAGYLDSNENIKVLNLNSPWGSGKTFFLNNWKEELKEGRACVYFNAWERDFTGDAFVSLVAAIREQLILQIGPLQESADLINNFTKVASRALIAATPALAKGLVKKLTGTDVGVIVDALGDDALADAAEKAVEKLIEANKENIETVENFKKVFAQLLELAAKTVSAGEPPKPVYLFIDELDRCRPTFAIELLERIKHLFDVQGCKFVIATDTVQLGCAVKAVYGSEFSANKYLKRFFDAEFRLDNTDIALWVKANLREDALPSQVALGVIGDIPDRMYSHGKMVQPDSDTILSDKKRLAENQLIFIALAKTFRAQFRELEKMLVQISAVHSGFQHPRFHFFWAAYLVFLKDEAPDLYENMLYGDWQAAMKVVVSRYSAKKLYFGSNVFSVHKIFEIYIGWYRGGEATVRAQYNNMGSFEEDFIRMVLADFRNEFSYMSSYPRLVDLAHSLE